MTSYYYQDKYNKSLDGLKTPFSLAPGGDKIDLYRPPFNSPQRGENVFYLRKDTIKSTDFSTPWGEMSLSDRWVSNVK